MISEKQRNWIQKIKNDMQSNTRQSAQREMIRISIQLKLEKHHNFKRTTKLLKITSTLKNLETTCLYLTTTLKTTLKHIKTNILLTKPDWGAITKNINKTLR